MKTYSLLITSCDAFEDAWAPFFQLYRKFWNDSMLPTYLITEKKKFQYSGINIITTQVANQQIKKLTWAQTVIYSLKQVPGDIVLMFMDDFFITEPVNIQMIDESAARLEKSISLDAIYLTANGPTDCSFISSGEQFCKVNQFSRYKVSMQACLWKKKTLLSLLKQNENAWMFELFGTQRAHLKKLNFLRVTNENGNPIKYINGIIKGKWTDKARNLFELQNINIDLQNRGFFTYQNKWAIKLTTLKAVLKSPIMFIYHFFVLPLIGRFIHVFLSARK
jgi:hypothetical protein